MQVLFFFFKWTQYNNKKSGLEQYIQQSLFFNQKKIGLNNLFFSEIVIC